MAEEQQVSLRDYLDARYADLERQLEVEIRHRDEMIEVVTRDLERRVEQLNRFQESMREEARSFITRTAYDTRHESLERRVGMTEKWQANYSGRFVGVAFLGAVFIAVVSALVTHLVS